jgi:hypothetical protein
MVYRIALALLLLGGLASCAIIDALLPPYGSVTQTNTAGPAQSAPRMEWRRKIANQDCSKPITLDQGNLRCR